MRTKTSQLLVTKLNGRSSSRTADLVAEEEPLAVRIQTPAGRTIPVTTSMRSPGRDFELAIGMVISERLATQEMIRGAKYCTDIDFDSQQYNVVTVQLSGEPLRDPRTSLTVRNSSCGLCGTAEIADLRSMVEPVGSTLKISSEELFALPDLLSDLQPLFSSTGGVHCVTVKRSNGRVHAHEDVGRHNAFDKVIGELASSRLIGEPSMVAVLSGRVSFEMVQKASIAKIELIAAVSAPTGLAIRSADEMGITLCGFVRKGSANVYTHPERIDHSSSGGADLHLQHLSN